MKKRLSVIYLKNIILGILVMSVAVALSVLVRADNRAYAANTLPGSNEVITIGGTTDGLPPDAPTNAVAYSGDGNVILFNSAATNLPNPGGSIALYTYNIKTNTSVRVDMSANGTAANGNTYKSTKLSETGRYVAFGSLATNLIDGTTQPQGLYYKRDMVNGTITVITGYSGYGSNQNVDRSLGISNDGRFSLIASRYTANSYPNNYKIILGNDVSGTYNWTTLGQDSNGGENAISRAVIGDLSCDGSFAAFQKDYGVFLADTRISGAVISVATNTSTSPLISCNGRYVLYSTTNRTQITPTPSGMDTYMHLVRYDRITGERMYIDSNSSGVFSTAHLSWYTLGAEPPANLFNASIADTGDVVFNYNGSMYLKHLSDGSGTLESIAKTTTGTYINRTSGTITKDGRYTFFMADPYDLGMTPSASTSQFIRARTGL
jgi:hypothetical protein